MSACIINKNGKYYLCTIKFFVGEGYYDFDTRRRITTAEEGFYLDVNEISMNHVYWDLNSARGIGYNDSMFYSNDNDVTKRSYRKFLRKSKVNRYSIEKKCVDELAGNYDYYVEQYERMKAGLDYDD